MEDNQPSFDCVKSAEKEMPGFAKTFIEELDLLPRISQESINLYRSASSMMRFNTKSTQACLDNIDKNTPYRVILKCWLEDELEDQDNVEREIESKTLLNKTKMRSKTFASSNSSIPSSLRYSSQNSILNSPRHCKSASPKIWRV